MATKVFLDTSVLLKAFLNYRKLKNKEIDIFQMQDFISDPNTQKFTFEKCIYEAYLAFRGIGGKKPDEGRGDWANRFLKLTDDPKPISYHISHFHNDSKEKAFLWVNHIESVAYNDFENNIQFIVDSDHEGYLKELKRISELRSQNESLLKLCNDFNRMLRHFKITELSYLEVFGQNMKTDNLPSFNLPGSLDSFVRETAIPSEDFEIVYAAERLGANIFVTDDERLITCSKSLGLNNFLRPTAFCTSKEYTTKKAKFLQR